MSKESEQLQSGRPWLNDRLATLEALYVRFGRDGLKDQPLADVNLLLVSKELAFRDSPKGHGIGETQQAANRQLELEIKDLSAYLNAQFSLAGGQKQHSKSILGYQLPESSPQKPRGKQNDMNRER